MTDEVPWDRLVLVATSAWLLPDAPGGGLGPALDTTVDLDDGRRRCPACLTPAEREAARKRGPVPSTTDSSTPSGHAVSRHEALLRAIVRDGQPGAAFLSAPADPQSRFALEARRDPLPHRAYARGPAAEPVLDELLDRLERHLVLPADNWVHAEPFVLRHRLIMDRPRFEAVTGFRSETEDELAYYVTLDFRLVRVADRSQRWHLAIVVWSDLPFGSEHRPGLGEGLDWRLREPREASPLTRPVEHYRRLFQHVARRTEGWLQEQRYEHSHLQISGRRYMQPDFWVAVPSTLRPAGDDLAEPRPEIRELAAAALRVDSIADDGVSTSVINGDYLVVRGIANGRDGDRAAFRPTRVPMYLIVVGDARRWLPTRTDRHVDEHYLPVAENGLCLEHARCLRYEVAARQEFCLRDLIDALTDMEAHAAFTLHDVHRDMQVWDNHLSIYETTAAAGGRLWDALATHLPVRRWRRLGRVHRAVELMHQTLLQGIADLNDLTTLSRDCAARVDRARNTLRERFDDGLRQRRHDPADGDDLRLAISGTGIFAQLAENAQDLVQHAERVSERYQDLIDAIKDAFDERRVREGDSIQKATSLLALSLSLGTITGIVAIVEPQVNGTQSGWLQAVVWASTAIVTVGVLAALASVTRHGLLGGHGYRLRYNGRKLLWRRRTAGLWRFMQDSSTEALEAHLRHRHDDDPAFWQRLDDRLSSDLAAIWDAGSRDRWWLPGPRRTAAHILAAAERSADPATDIALLSRQADAWGIVALLFTERAMRLYRYPLPKLSLLYRCISRLPGSYLRHEHLPATPANIVAEAELGLILGRRSAHGPNAGPNGDLDHRLVEEQPPTATAALAAINRHLNH